MVAEDCPLDPDAARFLARLNAPGMRGYDSMEVAEARAIYAGTRAATLAAPLALAEVRDVTLAATPRALPARLYRPDEASGAALVYFHGGGWVLGDLDSHDNLCRRLADGSGATVISVDYALAPEAPFPAGLEDAIGALEAVRAQAGELGIDPDRIAVGGDSAGGNLAVAACLSLRDAGLALPLYQLLIYPALDLSMSHASHANYGEGHLLTRAFQAWCHHHYLAGGGDVKDWRVSPLRAESLAGLPPAFVLTASHDPLRDEGEEFARRLAETGTPVTLWRVMGQIHAFLPMDGVMSAAAPVALRLARHLRCALG